MSIPIYIIQLRQFTYHQYYLLDSTDPSNVYRKFKCKYLLATQIPIIKNIGIKPAANK